MTVKRLKELLNGVPEDTEIFIRNSFNPCGNIQEMSQVEVSSYGFFGTSIACVIFNTDSSKELELTEEDEVVDFISE